ARICPALPRPIPGGTLRGAGQGAGGRAGRSLMAAARGSHPRARAVRPRGAHGAHAALLVIGLLLLGPAASAAPRNTRVLLILDRADDGLAERVRSEIAGIGFTVVPLEAWRRREGQVPLESLARAERAVAAIRVLPSRKGVEVWMADET